MMDRKNFGFLAFILLTFVLFILLVFNTVTLFAVTPPTIDNYPQNAILENIQGGTFTLHHTFTYKQAASGFYLIAVYWEYVNPNTGLPDNNYNFTLDNYRAYWDNGDWVECTPIFDIDNGSLHSQVFGNTVGEGMDGQFNVDIRYSLKGPDGTLHIETENHPFHYTNIDIRETQIADVYPDDVTIKVDPITRGVDVSVSPSLKTGWSGDNLSYNVTVTNTGNSTDNFDLNVTSALGWPHSVLASSYGATDNTFKDFMDTYIRENTPTTSYWGRYNMYAGTENNLVGGVYVIQGENAYAKWDLALAGLPAGAIIDNAYVWVVGTYGPSHNPGNVADNTWLEAWSVTDDTWDGLGDNITWSSGGPAMVSLLDNVHWIASAWIGQQHWWSFNVSSFVQSQYAGDKIVSIGWTSNGIGDNGIYGGNNGWFNSRDNHGQTIPAPYPDNYYRSPWMQVSWHIPVNTGALAPEASWTDNIWVVVAGTADQVDNLTLTATAPDNVLVKDNATVHARHAVAGVDVTINPPSKSGMGDTTFTVTVKNTGVDNLPDNYRLENIGTENWALFLENVVLGPISFGENKNTTLHVNIENHPGTTDNVTVKATSVHDNTVSDNDNCQAGATVVRGVQVVISPSNQENENGRTLAYAVTVVNLGNIQENFQLTKGDNAGWTLTLDNNWLLVPAYDNRTTNLTVNIPSNATGCTWDNIWVKALPNDNFESTLDNGSCLAHVKIVRGVQVVIEPPSQDNENGKTPVYTVTVVNTGNVQENFQLTKGDNAGWTLTLDNNWLLVPKGENKKTNLTVNIPSKAIGCTWDNIWVQATSQADPTVFDNKSCLAHVKVVRGVDVSISPKSIFGALGGTVVFTVTVKNIGNAMDNYILENTAENINWTKVLSDNIVDNRVENVGPYDNNYKLIKLTVTIPSDATPGTSNSIMVTATSQNDPAVKDNENCQAFAGAVLLYNENNILENAYTKIQPAIDNAKPNYTVLVYPGIFKENLYVNKENLKIRSYGGAGATIINAVGALNGVNIISNGVIFGGFTVENDNRGIWLDHSNNSRIENNIINENGIFGIVLYYSENAVINNNVVENNSYAGIYVALSNNNRIENNTTKNNGGAAGIMIRASNNNRIENNTSENNLYGIYLAAVPGEYSNNNLVSGNISKNNNQYGIYLVNSDNNRIENNIVENNNQDGIYLVNSDNNRIENNIANSNSEGIELFSSNNNTLDNNSCSNNSSDGIFLDNSNSNTVDNNTVWNSDYSGIYIYQSDNSHASNNTVENNSNLGIYLDSSENDNLTNNTCENNYYGIYLDSSDNNRIENNIASNNVVCIDLENSSNNTLDKNTCENSNSGDGIHLEYSDINTISNNNCENNHWWGIYLRDSSNNTLTKNNSSDNNNHGIFLNISSNNNTLDNNICENNRGDGIHLEYSDINTISNNNCNNNYYWGIMLTPSSNNTLENNVCEYNTRGIFLNISSDNNILDNNTCSNNDTGIYFDSSENDNLTNNNCSNNGYGIYVYGDIYGNNMVRMIGNTIENNSSEGIYFDGEIYGNSLVQIWNNSISNNGSDGSAGIYFNYPISEDSRVMITGNTIDSNYGEGIYFDNYYIEEPTVLSVIYDAYNNSLILIGNNSISNNDSDGIYFGIAIYDNSKVVISGNTIDSNYGTGIYFDYDIYGNGLVSIDNNSISNNYTEEEWYSDGIYFGSYISDNAMVMTIGNTIDNNYNYGIDFDYEISGNSKIWIENNSTSNNGWEGIDFESDIYDNSKVMIIGNTSDNNYSYGIDFDGSYIEGNCIITLGNNSFSNNMDYSEGIDIDSSIRDNSMFSIIGNRIDNNSAYGINFDGADIYGNSTVWIDSNSISNNSYDGIYYNSYDGEYHIYENSIVWITRNTIDNNEHGIYINGDVDAPVVIGANDITNNVEIDSGIHVESGYDTMGLLVGFNNIVGNSPNDYNYGVFNGGLENLKAPYNWWGDENGPGGVGPGTTGDNISENVIYRPWIPDNFKNVLEGFALGHILSTNKVITLTLMNPFSSNLAQLPETVKINYDSTENAGIVVTMFNSIGGAPIPQGLKVATFLDIRTIPENMAENYQITFHYTDADVSGIDEGSLGLYYWSSDDNSWHLCDNATVNTAANTVSGSIGHLTPFGIFGVPVPPSPPAPPAAPLAVGVSVSISPSAKSGLPGSTLSYTVTVMNTGENTDTFALVISGGLGWFPDISPILLNLAPGVSGTATLTVIVPSDAAEGDSTTIVATAISRADPSVSSSASCKATASVPTPGPGPTPTPTGISWGAIAVIAGAIVIIIILISLLILFFER
jgi:parallel beta-helix repeat protein